MNIRTSLIIFIGLALILWISILTYESSINETHRKSVQYNIVSALRKINNCQESEVDLSSLIREEFSDICLQPSYMSRDDFERGIGKKASGYTMAVHDGKVTWWLYHSDNHTTTIDIPSGEISEAPEARLARCFTKIDTVIVFKCKSGKPYYKFRTK